MLAVDSRDRTTSCSLTYEEYEHGVGAEGARQHGCARGSAAARRAEAGDERDEQRDDHGRENVDRELLLVGVRADVALG